MEKAISDNTIEGHCSGCGRCCTDILLLSESEIKEIKNFLKKHPEIKPINRSVFIDKVANNVCPFLSQDKKCSIYSVRANICKNFLCSDFCKKPTKKDYNFYKNVKVVSMMETFFPEEKVYGNRDLSTFQIQLEFLQKKIYK